VGRKGTADLSVVCSEGAKASQFECAESVQGSLEVVEDHRVRKTFEYEGELPERIDTDGETGRQSAGNRADAD